MTKRLLSTLLCLCLLLTMLPTTALAAVSDLLGNTGTENQSILQQLASFTDGDSDKAYALLDKLGLLDADGNLNTDQSILVDGRELTLAQVEAMLAGADVDLTKIVTVGDTPISLGDLKTIIEIETELARIKDTYFSDRTFTQEQLLSLNSLLSQIEYSGLSLQSSGSGAYTHDARLKIGAAEIVQSVKDNDVNFTTNAPTITKTVTLETSGTIGADASFQWRLNPGSIPENFISATLNEQTPGTLTVTSGTTYTLCVTFGINDTNLYSLPGFANTDGQMAGLIEFYNPQNLLFQTNAGVDAETLQLPIRFDLTAISSAYYGGWSTTYDGLSFDTTCGTTP